MPSRERKLATIGLVLRDDVLLHTLMQVIRTRTVDSWTLHSGLDADVVLCNPDSTLAGVALRRAGEAACVSLIHDGQTPLPGTRTLRAPIKSNDLIALLNEAPHATARSGQMDPAAADASEQDILEALHGLMSGKSPTPHAVESRAGVLLLTPADQALHASAALTEADVLPWLQADRVRVRQIDQAALERTTSQRIDNLLWMIGLLRTGRPLLRGLPPNGKFRLKRWPDFGRLAHEACHFRMAALLSRGEYTTEQVAEATGRPIGDVHAFINACALCDLLVVDCPPTTIAPSAAPSRDRRNYSSILKTIRSALGLRV